MFTFIHGIANKVPADDLLSNWKFELSQGGLDLAAKGGYDIHGLLGRRYVCTAVAIRNQF